MNKYPVSRHTDRLQIVFVKNLAFIQCCFVLSSKIWVLSITSATVGSRMSYNQIISYSLTQAGLPRRNILFRDFRTVLNS